MSDWYKIRMSAPRTADIDILADIGGWWDGVDAATMVRDIRDLDADEIRLNINSGGGSVFDAVAILNALRQHPAKVVANVSTSVAMSCSVLSGPGVTPGLTPRTGRALVRWAIARWAIAR